MSSQIRQMQTSNQKWDANVKVFERTKTKEDRDLEQTLKSLTDCSRIIYAKQISIEIVRHDKVIREQHMLYSINVVAASSFSVESF